MSADRDDRDAYRPPPGVTPVRDRAEIEARIAALAPTLRALGVERVRLFGSFVRGEQTAGSDVDLLVDVREGATLLGLTAAWGELQNALGRGVDLPQAGALSPYIGPHILREAEDVPFPPVSPAQIERALSELHPCHRRRWRSFSTFGTAVNTSAA